VTRKKSVDEWALDYWLLQQYAKFCFRIFYRKVAVENLSRIPLNQPVILAPNHQNALMDAMVLVCNTPFQNVFLARADIFMGKRLTRFLTYLNIMPIYRIRDGIENVKRNDEVFEKTLRVLRNKFNPLCVFPEGNHGDRRRLRPLVKGLFRIAFMAQEDYKSSPGVKIVPVGYDYSDYEHFRGTLFVNVGEPIEVSDYFALYVENPVAAINQLKDDFSERLSRLMIDIQSDPYYNLYMSLRKIGNAAMRKKIGISGHTLALRFKADKVMIEKLDARLHEIPAEIDMLNEQVMQYEAMIRQAGTSDEAVAGNGMPALLRVFYLLIAGTLLFPVYLAGLVTHLLPVRIIRQIAGKIRDTQFRSSVKYVLGMVIFPIWYLLMAVATVFLPATPWVKMLVVVLLPFFGIFTYMYCKSMASLVKHLKLLMMKKEDRVTATNMRQQIIRYLVSL